MNTHSRSMIFGSLLAAGVLASGVAIVPAARAADACFPSCRAGYLCSPSGTCVSACNPPCPDSMECSSNLTCVAKGAGGGAAAPSQAAPAPGYPPPQQPSSGYPQQPAPGYPQQPAGGYAGAPPPPPVGYPNAVPPPSGYPAGSGYPAAAGAPPVVGQTAPPVARNPFLALPFIGVESFQNASLTGEGPGLRLGFVAGARLSDAVSINGEAVFDVSNLKNVPTGVNENEYTFQLSVAPLFHFAPPGTPIELAAGPKLGFFRLADSATGYGTEQDVSVVGLLVGANVAAFGRVSENLSLGGIFSFDGEKATSCSISPTTYYSCSVDNLDWFKVISFSAAALF